MFMSLIKIVFYIAVIMSTLITFYYVELYNKLLKEVELINKRLNKIAKAQQK